MLRASHLSPLTTPALCAFRHSVVPCFNLSSSLSVFQKRSKLTSFETLHPKTVNPKSLHRLLSRVQPIAGPSPSPKASFSAGSNSGDGREILVQHLLAKEDDLKLLLELQRRISEGEDLSNLLVEFSICPSKLDGGMLGWVRKGQKGCRSSGNFFRDLLLVDYYYSCYCNWCLRWKNLDDYTIQHLMNATIFFLQFTL